MAEIYAWRGDADHAFEWLERAYQRRTGLAELKAAPMFKKIRGDPRFGDFLRKLGMPAD